MLGIVVDARFPIARMINLNRLDLPLQVIFNNTCRSRPDIDLRRIRKPQRQLIVMDTQLHRVTHRCQLVQRNDNAGDQSHVQKVLPKLPFPVYRQDLRAFSNLQFSQVHTFLQKHC